MKGVLESDGGNVRPLWLAIQVSLKWCRRQVTTIRFAVSCIELYFGRCCTLKRTGTFVSERKVKLSSCVYFNVMF